MRIAISGRAPVTNMYESVVYVGLGVALFGALLEIFHRRRYVLTAAAAVATVALILADNCPVALDPSLQPLQPVLRCNFWLVTHVMTITMSYAAFALALGISNITLGYYLCGAEDGTAIESLTAFTYRAMQVGVLLLAAGTILGGVWADYSWGRFWGWDPKEVWALITLLGYLAVLHARYARLGEAVRPGGPVHHLLFVGRHGLVRRELRARRGPAQLWFRWRRCCLRADRSRSARDICCFGQCAPCAISTRGART